MSEALTQPLEHSKALWLVLAALLDVLYSVFWQLPIAVKRTHDANQGMGLVFVTFGFRWATCILGVLLSAVDGDGKFWPFLLSITLFVSIASVCVRLVCFVCMGFGDPYQSDNEYGPYKNEWRK